jgi:hypothetical protein
MKRPWRDLVIATFAAAMAVAVLAAGCSSKKKVKDLEAEDTGSDTSIGEPLPAPTAAVQINYSKADDSLQRATVSKYFGAEVMENRQSKSGRSAALIRFEGGVPIWEVKADRGLAGRIADLGSAGWAVKQLDYGKAPPHFTQVLPDEGPPEPLDRGAFYVFAIERASGATSYEAIKVQADGSLQAYAAQPRAGSSFLICCGLSSDFSEPVIVPDENISDDASNPDTSGGGDQSGAPSDSGASPPP